MKLRITHRLIVLGAAALALIPLAPRPAPAAPPAGVPVFASVDINKIQSQSTKKAKYDTDLHALADRLDNAFKQQAASIMLSSEDQNDLGTLLAKANTTEADRNRITALQTQAANAAKQLTDLQQRQNPTPADTTQLAALTSQYKVGQDALQKISDQYQGQLKTLNEKDAAEFTQGVKEAISAVAKQQGITVVFDSSVAVYTSNDITDEVVKRINK